METLQQIVEIQRIIRTYVKNLHSTNLKIKLKEMDDFLDAHDPPKLNLDEVNNFSRSITTNEIQALV